MGMPLQQPHDPNILRQRLAGMVGKIDPSANSMNSLMGPFNQAISPMQGGLSSIDPQMQMGNSAPGMVPPTPPMGPQMPGQIPGIMPPMGTNMEMIKGPTGNYRSTTPPEPRKQTQPELNGMDQTGVNVRTSAIQNRLSGLRKGRPQ